MQLLFNWGTLNFNSESWLTNMLMVNNAYICCWKIWILINKIWNEITKVQTTWKKINKLGRITLFNTFHMKSPNLNSIPALFRITERLSLQAPKLPYALPFPLRDPKELSPTIAYRVWQTLHEVISLTNPHHQINSNHEMSASHS